MGRPYKYFIHVHDAHGRELFVRGFFSKYTMFEYFHVYKKQYGKGNVFWSNKK
jgi:hypothetical protein